MILFLYKDKCIARFSYLHECTFKIQINSNFEFAESFTFLEHSSIEPFCLVLFRFRHVRGVYSKICNIKLLEQECIKVISAETNQLPLLQQVLHILLRKK